MLWKTFFLILAVTSLAADEVVIIGSGPAGLAAALYSARSGLETTVVEGYTPGGLIAQSYEVENYPGLPGKVDGSKITENMREQAEYFGARFIDSALTAVDLDTPPFRIDLADGNTLFAEALIIATGATPRTLGLPSEQVLSGCGVSNCAVCDGFFFLGKDVCVVGGGDTAVEEALYLTRFANHVHIIHRRDTLKASAHMAERAFSHPKIHFIWNHRVVCIEDPKQKQVRGVTLENTVTGEHYFHPCSAVFIAIGHNPNSLLFQDTLSTESNGYICTFSTSTATSTPGVFAAGDVADPIYRQAITAAASGCKAALDAYHYLTNKEPL